ncbi:MAG: hypothetical protein QOG52_1772 [Frankiaceae bacterium]|nr:hypothetical protein [Frankiaceae bacterium]
MFRRTGVLARAKAFAVITGAASLVLTGVVAPGAATAVAPRAHAGLIPEPGSIAPRTPLFRAHALPASVDLSAWDQPVGDQGQVNSCLSWAGGYGLLGWYANRYAKPGAPFAPMYAYSQIQATHGFVDDGSTMSEVMNLLSGQGIDTKADYLPQGDFDFHTQPTSAQRSSAAAHVGTPWHFVYSTYPYSVGNGGQAALETELAAGNPVILGIPAYDSFMWLTPANSYFDMPDATGTWGGHAVLAVGYDSTGVLIENSWGSSWGSAGYARLSWAFIAQRSFTAAVMPGGLATTTIASAPTVTGLTPSSGPLTGGTPVTISGHGFTGASAVAFGVGAATSFTVVTDDQIVATAPPGTATVNVTVTTAAGTSPGSPADIFTYTGLPAISSLTPATGPTSGGTVLTLAGSNFVGATAVSVGGVPAAFVVAGATAMTVTTPPGLAGPADVRVTNSSGQSPAGTARFQYVGEPVVTRLSPAAGRVAGGTAVVVSGTGFTGATSVSFGAVPATSFAVQSDVLLIATSPASLDGLAVTVSVTTPLAVSQPVASSRFVYANPPVLTRVSAVAGPVAGGVTVALTGSGFAPGMTARFGSVPASAVSVVSPTLATVRVPAHTAGIVAITVTTAGGNAVLPAAFRYVAKPSVSGITPPRSSRRGGAWITIRGAALTGARVSFGATRARSVVVVSATTLRVRVPAHAAGRVSLTVTTVGGTSRPVTFTFTPA